MALIVAKSKPQNVEHAVVPSVRRVFPGITRAPRSSRVVEVSNQDKAYKMAQIRYALTLFRQGTLLEF